MNRPPPNSRALTQIILTALIAFIVGFFVTLLGMEWLITHFVEPDTPWWEILHVSVSSIIIAVIGGLAFAAGAVWLLDRFQHWCGMYRCPYCGKRLKASGAPCDCPQARALHGGGSV